MQRKRVSYSYTDDEVASREARLKSYMAAAVAQADHTEAARKLLAGELEELRGRYRALEEENKTLLAVIDCKDKSAADREKMEENLRMTFIEENEKLHRDLGAAHAKLAIAEEKLREQRKQ